MQQSRNLTRAMNDLQSIYETVLQESAQDLPHHADPPVKPMFIKGTGPESADNFKEPEVDTTKQPEPKTDKKSKDTENVYEPHKFSQPKSRKIAKESISTFTMEDNIFDRLYKTVMENEELDGPELDIGDEDFAELPADEGEEEITIVLQPHQVDALREIIAQLEPEGEEEDLEDFAADDGFEGEELEDEPFPEGVQAEPVAVNVKGADSPKGSNKVGKLTTKGGHAQTGKIKKSEGDLEKAPDGVGKLTATGSGSNKVGATGDWGG
jgi:hypothetical protein